LRFCPKREPRRLRVDRADRDVDVDERTMIKTTRFRPIAPRPQEGVPSVSKEKLAAAATTLAPAPASAPVPAPPTKTVVPDAVAKKQKPDVAKLEQKLDHQHVKPDVVIGAQAAAKAHHLLMMRGGETNEISLDPKNFCYADLKSMSDYETSSVSTGFYGGYGGGGYYGGYGGPQSHLQYAGVGMAHTQHRSSGAVAGCCGAGGLHWAGGCGPSLAYAGGQAYGCQSQRGGGCSAGYPVSAPGGGAAVQFARSEQQTPSSAEAAAAGVKLDLDQDSVAKAFGDDLETNKKRNSESDGSVDTSSGREEKATKEKGEKRKSDSGSGSENETTMAPMAKHRMATSGSTSFLSCIANGSTNPLFHIEKRLACSFITEYLEKDADAIHIIERFDLKVPQKKQKV